MSVDLGWAEVWFEQKDAMLAAANSVLHGSSALGMDAMDVASTVMEEMIRKGPPPPDVPLRPLLVVAAKRRAIDAIRRKTTRFEDRRADPEDRSENEDTLEEGVEDDDLAVRAIVAVGNLPPRERYAIVERVMKERPAAEVGPELGVTPQRVSQLVNSGLDRIRHDPTFMELDTTDTTGGPSPDRLPRRRQP